MDLFIIIFITIGLICCLFFIGLIILNTLKVAYKSYLCFRQAKDIESFIIDGFCLFVISSFAILFMFIFYLVLIAIENTIQTIISLI